MQVLASHSYISNFKKMKKFVIYCIIFSMPLFLLLIFLETTTRNIPNSYSYKYNYIKTHGYDIQAISIGHSQLHDGFAPAHFYIPAFNLSNSAQNYIDDYYLLKEVIQFLPNLKIVILPIGYMNVGAQNEDYSLSERSCYYHKYMNVNYEGLLPLKYALECFDPYKASEKIYMYYFEGTDMIGCDSLGRRNHYLKDRKIDGPKKIQEEFNLGEHDAKNMIIQYEYYLLAIIEMLQKKGIHILLVSPPYYWERFYSINKQQQNFAINFAKGIQHKYQIYYCNLECDTAFQDRDFYDDSHLNEYGAVKFTNKLNAALQLEDFTAKQP